LVRRFRLPAATAENLFQVAGFELDRLTPFTAAQVYYHVRVIERLVDRGFAYAADGHVLFHVPSMPSYGRLSRRPLDDMIAGTRIEVAPYKKDPMDFVLTKLR
jgi:cysteinyl-tRNA synthetase